MSVLAIGEIAEGREHTDDGEIRTYRRIFWVETDDPTDDENIVLTATGLPQRFDYYETPSSTDVDALLMDITISQYDGSKTLWRVTCNYTTESVDPTEQVDNPLDEPPDISFSFETMQVPALVARDPANPTAGADWIRTAAKEPYNPPPTVDQSRLVCTISRNEPYYDVTVASQYIDAVNSDYFFGLPPRTAKIRSLDASFESKSGINYWRITYVIAFNELTWDLQLLNYGSVYLDSGGNQTRFVTTDGSAYLGFLKADGTKYTATTFTSTDLLRTYRVHKERPFAGLGLPISPNR